MTCAINGNTNGPCAQFSFNSANNRITNSGFTYDAAGNLTDSAWYAFQYDAEGRVTSVSGHGVNQTDVYNALGQRAEYTTTVPYSYQAENLFDPAGRYLGTYDTTGGQWWEEDIRFQGRILAYNLGGVQTVFLHKDALGSSHMAMGAAGNVRQDQLFYPWGESWQSLGTWQEQGFAGFDYVNTDTEQYSTDYRTYAPTQGRWLTPDPAGLAAVDLTNPQSFNRYAYVMNNPATMVDPTGLNAITPAPPCLSFGGFPATCSSWGVYGGDGEGGETYLGTVTSTSQLPVLPPNIGGGGGGGEPAPKPNIINWSQLQKLVHENNESSFCDEVIDCIVFKESSLGGGFNANALPPSSPSTGLPTSSAVGLMQVTLPAATTDNNNYPHATSGATLHGALSNPALNIFVGSEYLQILSGEYGSLRNGLNHYGGTIGAGSYANDVLNCVWQLQEGNFGAAEAAAHGLF